MIILSKILISIESVFTLLFIEIELYFYSEIK